MPCHSSFDAHVIDKCIDADFCPLGTKGFVYWADVSWNILKILYIMKSSTRIQQFILSPSLIKHYNTIQIDLEIKGWRNNKIINEQYWENSQYLRMKQKYCDLWLQINLVLSGTIPNLNKKIDLLRTSYSLLLIHLNNSLII